MSASFGRGGHSDSPEALETRAKKAKIIEGAQKFVAPMEGLIYLRASPNDPEFVSDGKIINPGDTVALIEVMKCFYPIKFEGAKPVKVTSVVSSNGASVSAGDVIFCYEVS